MFQIATCGPGGVPSSEGRNHDVMSNDLTANMPDVPYLLFRVRSIVGRFVSKILPNQTLQGVGWWPTPVRTVPAFISRTVDCQTQTTIAERLTCEAPGGLIPAQIIGNRWSWSIREISDLPVPFRDEERLAPEQGRPFSNSFFGLNMAPGVTDSSLTRLEAAAVEIVASILVFSTWEAPRWLERCGACGRCKGRPLA